jgi:hypothetical protein
MHSCLSACPYRQQCPASDGWFLLLLPHAIVS